MTNKTLREVTPDDYGRSVSFPRPASYDGGRRVFTGKLIRVTRQLNSMGRAEYMLMIEYGGPSYNRDCEQHGPLPGNFPIEVRHLWRDKEPGTTVLRIKPNRTPPTRRRPNPFISPHQ